MQGLVRRDTPATRRKALVSLAVLLVALWSATPAQAVVPDYTGAYTQSGSSCGNIIDPINIVFRGPYAYAQKASGQINYHAGWGDTSGSDQNLWVRDTSYNWSCRFMNFQRASGCGSCSRFHIRLWFIPASEQIVPPRKTAGDAHHEDLVIPCGHAVDSNGPTGSGFDWGRRELEQKFINAGHTVWEEYWGNTTSIQQCDDDWAGSNGGGGYIQLYHDQG